MEEQFEIINAMNNSSYNSTDPPDYLEDAHSMLVILTCCLTAFGILSNSVVLLYIILKKLFRNYVSSHFIAHLAFTNLIACVYLLPIYDYNLASRTDLFQSIDLICRFHSFFTTCIWSVIHYMTTCIAGVHLLTFARIHYDQLFGLHPTIICGLSWVIGAALGLPCLTNGDIAIYHEDFYHCIWSLTANGYKFLTYLVLLGVILPSILTWYAYVRVLGILYHSPIVFQALGLYKSRFLVYGFILSPLYPAPFLVCHILDIGSPFYRVIFIFMSYLQCIISPTLYGVSLFLMKEEDMALTARSHKGGATYTAPGIMPQQL